LSVWVTVDAEVNPAVAGRELRLLYKFGDGGNGNSGSGSGSARAVPETVKVEARSARSTVKVTVPPGGVVVYK